MGANDHKRFANALTTDASHFIIHAGKGGCIGGVGTSIISVPSRINPEGFGSKMTQVFLMELAIKKVDYMVYAIVLPTELTD